MALIIGVAVSYPFAFSVLLPLLMRPVGNHKLIYTSVLEPFLARFKLSVFSGFVISAPVTFYQLFAFMSPALKKKERRILVPVVFSLFTLFILGVGIGYWKILPTGIKWLLDQGGGVISPVLKVTEYITVVGWFLLAFGLAFETPMVLIALVKLGIISRDALKANWRVVYVAILIASAILTPDWSPITMLMLSVPMIVLYHLTILALRWL